MSMMKHLRHINMRIQKESEENNDEDFGLILQYRLKLILINKLYSFR